MSLEDLKNRISKCTRCGENDFCPFPTYKGVKGFSGCKDYIFVAAQPSMTIFPSQFDKRLYSYMAKYGFQNAHLTDLVKCRRKAGKELSNIEIHNCIEWLVEEVEIVNPRAIIALGRKKGSTFDVLNNYFRDKDLPVLGVTHYSNRFFSNKKYEREFETLRYYLDTGKYRHGKKIKDLITPKQRKMDEKQQRFSEFVDDLMKKGIREKEYRDAVTKWNKEHP